MKKKINNTRFIFLLVIVALLSILLAFKSLRNYKDNNILFEDSSGKIISKKEYEDMKNSSGKIYISTRKDSIGKVIYTLYSERDIKENKQTDNANSHYKTLLNKSFPNFNHKNLLDKEFTENSFKGNTTVYTFWFTKCKPCINEIPILNKLKNELKNVNFVSMTFETKKILGQFLEDTDFDFVNLFDTMELNKKLKINAYPLHIIVDENGEIKEIISGYLEDGLETRIKKVLPNYKRG